MLAVRLPQSIEKRLERLARHGGRTKTYYVREAILEHLEELEDLYLAESAFKRIRSGEKQTIAHEAAWPTTLSCLPTWIAHPANSTRRRSKAS